MIIHNATITGSLTLDGVDISHVTSSSGVSSSLANLSSSFLATSSSLSSRVASLENFSSSLDNTYATDQQLATVSGSLSGRISTIESKYTTTGSNQFNGNQVVTGSLTVTGQVIAQTLNVQQVTSSIVYSSGSNTFGNSIGNVQQFTGSLQVSGSSHYLLGNFGVGVTSPLHVLHTSGEGSAGQIMADQYGAVGSNILLRSARGTSLLPTASQAGDLLGSIGARGYDGTNFSGGGRAGMYIYAGENFTPTNQGSFIIFGTTAIGAASRTERVRITESGDVGVGTTTPDLFSRSNDRTFGISSTGNTAIAINAASSGGRGAQIDFGVNLVRTAGIVSNVNETTFGTLTSTPLNFQTNGATRVRITSDGDILLSTTSTGATGLGINNQLNISFTEGSGESYANIFRQRNTAALVLADGYKRSTTASFASSFSSAMAKAAIAIGYANGSISFFSDAATTVANGMDVAPTERMTIVNTGNIGIGTTTPNRLLELSSGSGSVLGVTSNTSGAGILYGRIALYSTAFSNSYINYGGEIRSYSGAGVDYSDLRFYTANGSTSTERMRIESNGYVIAPMLLGKSYAMTSGSGTGTAITDTGINYSSGDLGGFGRSSVFLVVYAANPNNGGSGEYSTVYLGYITVSTAWSGSAVTSYIGYNQMVAGNTSNIGTLTLTPVFWDGASEASSVLFSNISSNQIRVKISGYNSSFTGANQQLYLQKLIPNG